MASLADKFPLLATQLVRSLQAAGKLQLAAWIDGAQIKTVSFDADANAAYVSLEPQSPLNIVERNIVSVRFGTTMPVETAFWTSIDLDNFDRPLGVEILRPGVIEDQLKSCASG